MLRLLSLVALLSTASIAHAEPVVIERDALKKLIEKAEDSAKRLEKNLVKVPLGLQPKGMRAEIEDLRDELKKLRALVQKAPPAPPPTAPAPSETRPCLASNNGEAIAQEGFETILSRVSSANFAKDKLSALSAATQEHLFTMSQAGRLIGAFTFAADKLAALRQLVPRLTDVTLQGRQDLLSHFPLSGDKRSAEAIFAQCQ